ncbi:MAG: DUF3597 domain-containing protein [Chthoniobacterales bacterium]|nr:DUF3597 domain-containing protein [Chthoniobacterales bacterium]
MGLFKDLMWKIFSHAPVASASTAPAPSGSGTPATPGAPAATPAPASASAGALAPAAAAPQAPAQQVDVAATLDALAARNSEKLDWKHSIVDLMKLVGMDSSLSARKDLADDLHYTGDKNDSAAMNIWLHQAVMQELAKNGGKVPQDLLNK